MTKKHLLVKIVIFLAFIFGATHFQAQTGTQYKSKTVVFKIKKQGETNPLTASVAIDVDKLLNTKKGIITSTSDASTRTVSVVLEPEFPEAAVEELLRSRFHLEVESKQTTNNAN